MPAKRKDSDQTHELQMVEHALASLLDFFSECGLSAKNIQKALANASAGDRPQAAEPGGVKPLERASQCLQRWHTSERYTDRTGMPAPLPESGALSLHSLAVDCGHADPGESIALLKAFNLVDRRAKNFLPKTRVAKTPRKGLIPLWYGCDEITRSLETLTNNMRSTSKSTPLVFQRTANQVEFDRAHLPLFRRFMDDQGGEFIQMLDDWMEKHRKTPNGGDAVHASVHAFAWIDGRNDSKSTGRALPKKRSKVVKTKNRNA